MMRQGKCIVHSNSRTLETGKPDKQINNGDARGQNAWRGKDVKIQFVGKVDIVDWQESRRWESEFSLNFHISWGGTSESIRCLVVGVSATTSRLGWRILEMFQEAFSPIPRMCAGLASFKTALKNPAFKSCWRPPFPGRNASRST